MTYSNDLRERVIAAVEAGEYTRPDIASLFDVSESTITKWIARRRKTGQAAAAPWAGGKVRVLSACTSVIRTAVERQPDIQLAELCAHVAAKTGVVASASMMCRELQLLKLPLKKESVRQSTRHPARQAETRRI